MRQNSKIDQVRPMLLRVENPASLAIMLKPVGVLAPLSDSIAKIVSLPCRSA